MNHVKNILRQPALWAALIAGVAFGISRRFADFPVTRHPDEAIIGRLAERASTTGRLSANWDGIPEEWWSRPTYQFSPYILIQSALQAAWARTQSVPVNLEQQIRWARYGSAVYGAAASFVLFLAGSRLFGSVRAALWSQLIFSFAFVHLQDSAYARVEAFLSLCLAATLLAAAPALRRPSPLAVGIAAFLAGISVAAKYNAAPVAGFVLLLPLVRGERNPKQLVRLLVVAAVACLAGFIVATPELLRQPAPLWEGIRYEWRHYQALHRGHAAYNFSDNNLFYWTRYLGSLGIGWLPLLLGLAFVRWSLRHPIPIAVWLSAQLLCLGVCLVLPRVRFERNTEILLPPLALAAGCLLDHFCRSVESTGRVHLGQPLLSLIATAALGWQPAQTIYRFDQLLHPSTPPVQRLPVPPGSSVLSITNVSQFTEAAQQFPGWIVIESSAYPEAIAAEPAWRKFFAGRTCQTINLPWLSYGYPFSTVNVYHGPVRFLVFSPRAVHTAQPEVR